MRSLILTFLVLPFLAKSQDMLQPLDIYDLEFVAKPSISPDGNSVIFTRNFMDVMTDKRYSNLWISDMQGQMQRPITTGQQSDSNPIWSPDGSMIYYTSNTTGKTQIYKM